MTVDDLFSLRADSQAPPESISADVLSSALVRAKDEVAVNALINELADSLVDVWDELALPLNPRALAAE